MDDIIFPDNYAYKDWVKDKYKKLTKVFINKNFDLEANRRTLSMELQFAEFSLPPRGLGSYIGGKYSSKEVSEHISKYLDEMTSVDKVMEDIGLLNTRSSNTSILEDYPLKGDYTFIHLYGSYLLNQGIQKVKNLTKEELSEQLYLRVGLSCIRKAIPFSIKEKDEMVVARIHHSTGEYSKRHREAILKKQREHAKRKKELKLLEELKAKYEQ